MIENGITLFIGGEMKGTVGTSRSARMGQHLGSKGLAVLNMCWEDHFASSTTELVRLLCEFGQTALKLAPICCKCRLCGRVEGVRSSRSEMFTSRTSKAN